MNAVVEILYLIFTTELIALFRSNSRFSGLGLSELGNFHSSVLAISIISVEKGCLNDPGFI